jgi:RND family efflux transporter MFP subunit
MKRRFGLTRKQAVAGVAVAVAVATGAVVLARNQDGPKQSASVPQRVLEFTAQDLAQATREPVARTMPVTGTLTALQTTVLKTRTPGVLTAVLAREGEAVRAGQLLARVDDADVRAQLAAREADVAAARAQLDFARRNLQRQRDLLDKGFISPNAFDTVRNDEALARARLDAVRAQATQARKSLADQTLAAPIAGVIARRHAEPGERLPTDAPILTIVSLDKLEIAVDVPTSSIANVAVGQTVTVRVEGLAGRSFEGRVERINPQATAGAGVVPVYVVVDNPDHVLRAGLFVHGELVLASAQSQVTVPAAAVRGPDGAQFVYAIEHDRVVKRPVEVAFVSGNRAVLSAGLADGATVVAANLGELPDGAQARMPAAAGRS